MKTITILFLLFLHLSCQSQTHVFQTEWAGHINLLGQMRYAQITLKKDTATFRLPDEGPVGTYLIEGVKTMDRQIEFAISHQQGQWIFKGKETANGLLKGSFQTRNATGNFLFYKWLPIEKTAFEPCLGNFQLPSGDCLRIWQRGERQRLHSPISRRYTGLRKIEENRFLSMSNETLQFGQLANGQFQSVEWQSPDGQKIMAKRVNPIRIENHLIVTSTDTIGASLYLPNAKGKHPACIIPIGAARYDRSISDLEAELFATYGIATLIYDNHGFGQSTGNLQTKTFVDKQQTAIELFRWLEKHSEIDASKIGFRGGSQGGRISLMAASVLPETAFVIALATPMETRMDQQLYALAAHHRNQGYSEEVIARSSEIWRQFFLNAAASKVDAALTKDAAAMREEYPNMYLPNPSADTPARLPWQDDILNSTASYLPSVKCPVQCLFGSLDERVPAQKSILQLRQGLKKAGHAPPEVIVYEGAGHSFMLPGFRIAEGLFMDQVGFVRKEVGLE